MGVGTPNGTRVLLTKLVMHIMQYVWKSPGNGNSGADPGIYVRGSPWIGEGSGDYQRPQRVQGSAPWGALGGEAPQKLMRIRNLRR